MAQLLSLNVTEGVFLLSVLLGQHFFQMAKIRAAFVRMGKARYGGLEEQNNESEKSRVTDKLKRNDLTSSLGAISPAVVHPFSLFSLLFSPSLCVRERGGELLSLEVRVVTSHSEPPY